ncbi:MAG: hypothetical protein JJ971_06070 [Balneolaceae bacterium]|nr:hypothetical protein [Balneolaceae bacterium]MBO6545944.1 hypothetical protein [Balneolaceae bacterium]MBO6647340.1 hypothetical protein [Balneolaceae bacterium]
MHPNFLENNKALITASFTLLVLAHLLIEHFQGGVVTHYFFQNDSLPGISNWWGLLTVPITSWLVLLRIEKRNNSNESETSQNQVVIYRFISGIIFGVLLTYFFSIGSKAPEYMMLGLFAISLFIPLHFGEYLMGFVLGAMYVLGANIPITAGIILMILFFTIYKLPRFIYSFITQKNNSKE